MTGVGTMIEFTPEAESRLSDYLRQVRTALAGAADVNPDEIEADIREHVENELHAVPGQVGVAELEAVLARLGPPSQWGAGENPSLFRRAGQIVRERLRLGERIRHAREAVLHGPEDWRLAYLSFGVFAVGALTVFAFPIALLISYVLSRAGLAVAKENGVALGAGRKWLLYPPVVIVSSMLLISVVAMPVAAGIVTGAEVAGAENRVTEFDRPNPEPVAAPRDSRAMRDWQYSRKWKERMASQVEADRELLATIPVTTQWAPAAAGLFVGVGACAMWWTILGLVGATFPGAVRAVFFPLTSQFRSAHGWRLALPCAAVLVLWGVAAYEVAAAAGAVG